MTTEWPADKVERWTLDRLIPYARNARTHSEEQVAQIAASVKEWGWTVPVLVDEGGGLIAGHGRLLAARQLGLTDVPVMVARGWSDAQKKAYVLADNKLALNAGWDNELLSLEVMDIEALGFDVGLAGFSDDELAKLTAQPTGGLTDADEVPDIPQNPVTSLGDLWLLGKHRVMCGDSTSVDAVASLLAGKNADFCFTSPPYNSARGKGHKSDRLSGNGFYGDGYNDARPADEYIQFNIDILSTLATVAGRDFVCCYNINYNKNSPSEYLDVAYHGKNVFPLVETIVWEKQLAVSLQGDNLTRIYEFVFVFCNGRFKINKNRTECLKNLWKISNIGANTDTHKACFPVALVEEGIRYFAPHGANIVEPFGGSGTTLIAAEKTGCTAHLMELDPRYVDVSLKRWQEFTGQAAILEQTGETFAEVLASRQPGALIKIQAAE